MFFGIPEVKDELASQAYAEEGIVQRALREAKRQFPEIYRITDVCLCEYTSHGHCGMLCGQEVDNDNTLELLANNGAVVESSVLPGRTDRRSGLYVLGEEAGPAVQAFFNVADSAPASGTQSA